MASPDFVEAREIIQAAVADSSNPTFIDTCLNQAQREVARARRWPELMTRLFFNTEAAYTTGTMAVTINSTTITLTTGTLPTTAASSGMRFALSVSDPWYTVRTRTSGAVAVLAQAYVQASDTSTPYVIYKSHYSLPSNIDRIEEVWLHDAGTAVPLVNAATDQHVTDFLHFPSGPGVPTHFYMMERDASGNRQMLLGPETPDAVYRVEYVARRKVVDNQFSGNLDDSRWPVILARAKALAYEPEFYDRSVTEMTRYRALLDAEWTAENEAEPQHIRVGQNRVDFPAVDGMEYLLGRGRVADPS